jgi:predicted RNase H-like nuclease (RuvC/YqgF family)
LHEELKRKVKPKLLLAGRKLADVAKLLSDFETENQVDGKPVFSRTLKFYLDAIRFESKPIIDGLDEEIANVKREMDKTQDIRLKRIKSLEECANKMTNILMEQGQKVEELKEFLDLPEK